MKRIDIRYGGDVYSVGGRDFEELRQEILDRARRAASTGSR